MKTPHQSVQSGKKTRDQSRWTVRGLMRLAGLDKPGSHVESLEERKMLYSITANDIDPATGVGSVSFEFPYWPAILQTPAQRPDDPPTPVSQTESFNEQPFGPVGSNLVFNDSGLQFIHNVNPPQDFAIAAEGAQTTDNTARFLRVGLDSANEQFSMRFFEPINDNEPAVRRGLDTLTLTLSGDGVADLSGLDTNQVVVQLKFRNSIIREFRGNALRALIQNGANGTGTMTIQDPQNLVFDEVTFLAEQAFTLPGSPRFRIDDVVMTSTPNVFEATFGTNLAVVGVLTGPVGATVDFFDLLGRPMVTSQNAPINPDLNRDGLVDLNYGIGRVEITGSDARTSLTLWGATFTESDTPEDDAFSFVNGRNYKLIDSVIGNLDDYERVGVGLAFGIDGDDRTTTGLPPGPASIIIGSPYFLQSGQDPFGPRIIGDFIVRDNFNLPDQGIFVRGGQSIGSISAHALLFGSSVIEGYVDKFNVGVLLGSLSIGGDAGTITIGGDAGVWGLDPNFDFADANVQDNFDIFKSNSVIQVGRTLGELAIGGRSLADVVVGGDLASPTTKPAREAYEFYERETHQGFDPATPTIVALTNNLVNRTLYGSKNTNGLYRNFAEQVVLGNTFARNDSITSSEFVGNAGAGVRIFGDISGQDSYLGEDRADVYGFAVTGNEVVVIEGAIGTSALGLNMRIVDQFGRTLAAPVGPGDNVEPQQFLTSRIEFKPQDGPGVYYLVVTDDTDIAPEGDVAVPYGVVITGMAPVTLGAYRTGGGSGVIPQNTTTVASNAVNVLSGNIGSVRVGTGFMGADGTEQDPDAVYNRRTDVTLDNTMGFLGGVFTAAGNVYNIIAGADVGVPNGGTTGRVEFRVGGSVGSIITGLSPVVGIDRTDPASINPNEGDLNQFFLFAGGGVGQILVAGGIGVDQDNQVRQTVVRNSVVRIETGRAGGRGDIGKIRVGYHVVGDVFQINTSPGSVIGQLLVSQDAYTDPDTRRGIFGGQQVRGIPVTIGAGSDLRFFDTPEIDYIASADARIELTGGTPVEFIDDSGARVRISVTNAPVGANVGFVRLMGIDGSQGSAIGQIEVDLTGGRGLVIQSLTATPNARVSIGRIVATSDATSTIDIDGLGEVDVLRIDALGGMNSIRNNTLKGDIVAVDAATLNSIDVRGSLGRTEMPTIGPSSFGLDLGVAGDGLVTDVRGPLGFLADNNDLVMEDDYNGIVFRPLADDNFAGGNAYGDDIGVPMDGFLAGVVVRDGDVQDVRVDGALGDLILQGDTGTIVNLTLNADNVVAFDGFDGIIGTVYAANIGTIDIGDGIAAATSRSPVGVAGVFVTDDINTIRSAEPAAGSSRRVLVGGPIIAVNSVFDPVVDVTEGINNLTFPNAQIVGAIISSGPLDRFWRSFTYLQSSINAADVGTLDFSRSTLFRSQVNARVINDINLTDGLFDASVISATTSIGTVRAKNFRNSTLDAGLPELVELSAITVAGPIGTIEATEDIRDLVVDATGDLSGSLTARNIIAGSFDFDGTIEAINVRGDLRSTRLTAGDMRGFTVGNSITTTTLRASGRLESIAAANAIVNSDIAVTGPDGSIGRIAAPNGVSGRVATTGPIGSIAASQGDVRLQLTTANANGDVGSITAGRDADLRGDIAGGVTTLTAGRHFGNARNTGGLVIRKNLGTLSAPAGVLYNDLRVGGTIGAATLGSAIAKPDNDQTGTASLSAFQGITSVSIAGDFGGDIISYSGGIGNVTITNGSLLPGRLIAAYDGSIQQLTVTNGNLLGNVHADVDIVNLQVTGGGAFGNVGIDPNLSPFNVVDARRNQLPVGVQPGPGFDGARVSAGRNIQSVSVANSVFESGFIAGRVIQSINVAGRVANNFDFGRKGSFFAAGDTINTLNVTGSIADTLIVAGLTDLGSDNRPGGVGTAADSVKSGNINTITTAGTFGVSIIAGVTAGADGVYDDDLFTGGDEGFDARLALGTSTVGAVNVSQAVSNTQIFAASLPASINADGRFVKRLPVLADGVVLDTGVGFAGTALSAPQSFDVGGGVSWTIGYSGGGEAFFDAASRRVTLRNTSGGTLTISSSGDRVENLRVISNNDASLASLTVSDSLAGNSEILVDSGIGTISVSGMEAIGTATPRIITGGDVGSATFGSFLAGSLAARSLNTLTVNGDFAGDVQAMTIGAVNITGRAGGIISSDRDVTSVATGDASGLRLRAGNNLGTVAVGAASRTVISAGDNITSVAFRGNVFDSAISAGLDTGREGAIGADDVVSSGNVGPVTVNGNFLESDVTAGVSRGPDGYFGTRDDRVASGRSTIGAVTISGNQTGSTRASESYRVIATGGVGNVSVGGQTLDGTLGNFAVDRSLPAPLAVEVTDVQVRNDSNTYTANIFFNQPMDFASAIAGLSVSEIRGTGEVQIRLVEGADYTTSYNPATNSVGVTFSREITQRNLPQVPGRPGPGVYRFAFDPARTSARLAGARFDGDSNGLAKANEALTVDTFVGDVGDKITAQRLALGTGGFADLYAPGDLDIVLDNNFSPDGLPDINKNFTIRGAIGDHPDHNVNGFRFWGDVDIYKVTLQAGQILRLGTIDGAASLASVQVIDAAGISADFIGVSNQLLSIPSGAAGEGDLTFAQTYLVKATGTYYITIGDATQINNDLVSNPSPIPGALGEYAINVTIFDDGDTGFTSDTDSGDGRSLANVPAGGEFAGVDGTFGTADDLATIERDGFTFTLDRATNIVRGEDGNGAVATRDSSGRITQTVDSAVGLTGVPGAPAVTAADIDVYHLNGRQPIAPGTKMRVTMRLNDLGGDLGSNAVPSNLGANRGAVQLALFDTTDSTAIDDANVVFAPTDFSPTGGTPNTVIADNGSTKYGFDNKGDFYIEFATPERLGGASGEAGTFALYVQGLTASNYQLEVVTEGTAPIVRRKQNVFLELNGGSIDWLLPGGVPTTFAGFDAKTLGFTGTVQVGSAVRPVQDYIVERLVASVSNIYRSAGLDVVVSTNPADFEFQPFSTVFVTSTNDKSTPIFNPFTGFNFFSIDGQALTFQNYQPYGASERSDPLNASLEDEAVVFVPSFTLLSLAPTRAEIDDFVTALTASVARRVGEMVGLRITSDYSSTIGAFTGFDPFAANSVDVRPGLGQAYQLLDFGRLLSTSFDSVGRTDFFLGAQRSLSLLQDNLAAR